MTGLYLPVLLVVLLHKNGVRMNDESRPARTLDRDAINALVPHSGRMLLLDSLVEWQGDTLHAISRNHTDPEHPLRLDGRLPASAGIEYAAQAMALHSRLQASGGDAPGMPVIAAINALHCAVDRLDNLTGPMDIRVRREHVMAAGAQYTFSLSRGALELAAGVLLVVWSLAT